MIENYVPNQSDFDLQETEAGQILLSYYDTSYSMPLGEASALAERLIKLIYSIHLAQIKVVRGGDYGQIGGVPIPEDLLIDLPWGPKSY